MQQNFAKKKEEIKMSAHPAAVPKQHQNPFEPPEIMPPKLIKLQPPVSKVSSNPYPFMQPPPMQLSSGFPMYMV